MTEVLSAISEGRHQNVLPLTTIFSQNITYQSKWVSYAVVDLCRCFTKRTGFSALHSNLKMVRARLLKVGNSCSLHHFIFMSLGLLIENVHENRLLQKPPDFVTFSLFREIRDHGGQSYLT